jgi:L-seryl-tRNA(Ser) seleniumtransferase
MMHLSVEEISQRAQGLAQRIGAQSGFSARVQDGLSVIGGGSTPGQSLPTKLIAVSHKRHSAQEIERILRKHSPPILSRVERDEVLLDLRTVFDDQDEQIAQAFERL